MMKPRDDNPVLQDSPRSAIGVNVWLLLALVVTVIVSVCLAQFAGMEVGIIVGLVIFVVVTGVFMVKRRRSHEQSFDSNNTTSIAVDMARPLLRPALPLLKRGRLYAKTMKDKAELVGSTAGRTGYLDTMYAEHVQEAERHERYQAGTQKVSDLARQMKLRKSPVRMGRPLRKTTQIGTDVMPAHPIKRRKVRDAPAIPTVQDITSPADRYRASRKI